MRTFPFDSSCYCWCAAAKRYPPVSLPRINYSLICFVIRPDFVEAPLLFSSANEDELPEPGKGFKSRISAAGAGSLANHVPAKGYYLYEDKIRFALMNVKGVRIRAIKLPKGEIEMDTTFGKMKVYRYFVQVNIRLQVCPRMSFIIDGGLNPRSRNALPSTKTLDSAIAPAANTGDSSIP